MGLEGVVIPVISGIASLVQSHPYATAVVTTAVSLDWAVQSFRERSFSSVGDSLGNIAHCILSPFAKGTGIVVGRGAVDIVESIATGVIGGINNRVERLGNYFEKEKLTKWFGEKNLKAAPGEYVDITQLVYRRLGDIVSDNATPIFSLTGGTGLIAGGYLAYKAHETYEKNGSEREKIKYVSSAAASLLLSTYLLGKAILG